MFVFTTNEEPLLVDWPYFLIDFLNILLERITPLLMPRIASFLVWDYRLGIEKVYSVCTQVYSDVLKKMKCGGGNLVEPLVETQKSEEELSLQTWRTPVYIGALWFTLWIMFWYLRLLIHKNLWLNRNFIRRQKIMLCYTILLPLTRFTSDRVNIIETKNLGKTFSCEF